MCFPRGTVEQHEVARVFELPGGVGEHLECVFAARLVRAGDTRFHAGGAVDEQQDGVRRGGERPAEPAADKWPGEEK